MSHFLDEVGPLKKERDRLLARIAELEAGNVSLRALLTKIADAYVGTNLAALYRVCQDIYPEFHTPRCEQTPVQAQRLAESEHLFGGLRLPGGVGSPGRATIPSVCPFCKGEIRSNGIYWWCDACSKGHPSMAPAFAAGSISPD